MTRTAVLGAGSWGTALSLQLCRNGHEVLLWGHDPEHIVELQQDKENRAFLPGFTFPDSLHPVSDLGRAVLESNHCLLVSPSHAFGEMVTRLAPYSAHLHGLLWATKGLHSETGSLLHHLAREALGPDLPLAILSGPSFALEVAANLPTAVTVAGTVAEFTQQSAALFHGNNFRAYTSHDLVGVEICGAAKNIFAIATGLSDGLGFGANTRVAIITRGLAELVRIGTKLGGKQETFMGLAGVGDLILTCTDNQSRNRRFGLALAQGKSLANAKDEIGQEVEGVITALAMNRLAAKLEVEMPICEQVYRILYQNQDPNEAARELLQREAKPEFLVS